jgi:hypothetical protein
VNVRLLTIAEQEIDDTYHWFERTEGSRAMGRGPFLDLSADDLARFGLSFGLLGELPF